MDAVLALQVPPFAETSPPPPPLIIPLNLTDIPCPQNTPLLDCEDFDPSQKLLDIARAWSATPSVRFHPYVNTASRHILKSLSVASNQAAITATTSKGKKRAISSPLSSVPSSPWESPVPSTMRQKLVMFNSTRASNSSFHPSAAAVAMLMPRPKNAGRQNLEKLLKWKAEEYKDFRVSDWIFKLIQNK